MSATIQKTSITRKARAQEVRAVLDFDSTHIFNDAFLDRKNSLLEFKPVTKPAPPIRHTKQRALSNNLYGGWINAAVLTAADERGLFLKLNYAKFLLSIVQTKLEGRASKKRLAEAQRLIDIITITKQTIVIHNLRLIIARTPSYFKNYEDEISERNITLMRCVDKFDISRNFKFSTYVVSSLLKSRVKNRQVIKPLGNELRTISKQEAQYEAYLESLDARPNFKTEERDIEIRDQARIFLRLFKFLNDKEAFILKSRYGIDGHDELTLAQIGERFGVTKERVRQLELRAIESLRRHHEIEEQGRTTKLRSYARANCRSNSGN